MRKPKVILIQETLQNYRVPIYKLMQKELDLTLAYTVRNEINDSDLEVIQLPYFKIGPFYVHKRLYRILNQYEVVISLPHLRAVRICLLQWLPRKFKLVTWTIGKHANYNTPFDLSKRPSLLDRIFETIQDGADACIFYMQETIDYWTRYKKIDVRKYFEAHNTVAVADFGTLPSYESRDSFLFVGSLYAQKGIGELIEAYCMAKEKNRNLPRLNIVGRGEEKEAIELQIQKAGLAEDICLCGAIYDEEILKEYFLKALLCISPKQAGLTVLKSLGYGCPFVTRPDAITGGERDNVKDGENGLFFNTVEELSEILLDVMRSKTKYAKMSVRARDYYTNHCSPELMAEGALSAVRYVLNN